MYQKTSIASSSLSILSLSCNMICSNMIHSNMIHSNMILSSKFLPLSSALSSCHFELPVIMDFIRNSSTYVVFIGIFYQSNKKRNYEITFQPDRTMAVFPYPPIFINCWEFDPHYLGYQANTLPTDLHLQPISLPIGQWLSIFPML